MMNIKTYIKKGKNEQITVFYDNLNRIEKEFIKLSMMAEVLTNAEFDKMIDAFDLVRKHVNDKLREAPNVL